MNPALRVEESADYVRVASDFWIVEHLRQAGGAWHSIVLAYGTGKNLFRAPFSSSIRILRSDSGTDDAPHGYFVESNEHEPRMHVERTGDSIAVIAEGTYRNVNGTAIPVGFRRRTEYRAHGLIWTTLQLMSECGCSGAVEVRGLDLPLRAGLSDAYVRFHPTQAGGADLLGGRTWIQMAPNSPPTKFLARHTPLHIGCFEAGLDGIELFPGSDLAQWDCAFKPDIGLGLYRIGQAAVGASVAMVPYSMPSRKMKVTIQGTTTLRLGIVLSENKWRQPLIPLPRYHFISDPETTDAEIEHLAAGEISLVCFKDDYRDGGEFWRNGAVTPYDAQGMRALQHLIESCQRCQIKIVPYISLHELHPDNNAYEMNARAWMHMAARSLDVVHNWRGTGESGALMCLRSGWLDYRMKTIDAILRELPWDGLCLDWPGPLPCCHPGHGTGPFHTDTDELLELLFWCRTRVGPEGRLAILTSSDASIMAANIADQLLPFRDNDRA